jgi:hypothetical protein
MREPSPTLLLLVVQGLAVCAVVGWWLGLPPAIRTALLVRVSVVEQSTLPPATLGAQALWLVQHRLTRLRGVVPLGGAAALIGLVEGAAWRQRHPWGGVSVMRLRLGHTGLALTGGSVLGSLVVPWPLPLLPCAVGLAGVLGMSLYGVAAGAPRWH